MQKLKWQSNFYCSIYKIHLLQKNQYLKFLKDIYLNKTQYKDQTISINTNINSLNFNLSKTEKENLFNSGYQKTMEYITSHYYLFKQNPDLLMEIKKHKYHENILET